jgi:alkylation response protein AidB-like acyl-CoA dehydrogenase
MTAGLVMHWLAAGELDLPLPGSGATAQRWRKLADLTAIDVAAGRLAEVHADAIAILRELGGPETGAGQLWGVWTAEMPDAVLRAHTAGDMVSLEGTKAWCTGGTLCDHALVTAQLDDGRHGLFAVDVRNSAVRSQPSTWRNPGMVSSDVRSVQFSGAPAVAVGRPGEYLDRPGIWHGAMGVAACWLGGARAVATPLYQHVASGSADEHALAHLGAVDAAITAAEAVLATAAIEVDDDPLNESGRAELTARRLRAVAETAVDQAITRTGRALGLRPLCIDGGHARRVADLAVFVRHSHAERDLAALGLLAGATRANNDRR